MIGTWFKRLILCFCCFAATVLLTLLAGVWVMPMLGYTYNLDDARKVGWALSPFAILLYARTWRKSDFAPQPPLLPSAQGSSSFLPKLGIAFAILIGGSFAVSVVSSVVSGANAPRPAGSSAFHTADMLLVGRSKGISHGNTPEAETMASKFSSRLKAARNMGVEARKSPALVSLSGGEFLTYCLLTSDRCVFLVHVPDLRKFSPGAKDYIADAALSTALNIARTNDGKQRTVVVGIRGALLYDRVVSAHAAISHLPGNAKGDDESRNLLREYFTPPAPKTVPPNATASTKSAPSRPS